MADDMKIVYRKLDDIKLLEKNFKRHALDEAEASVRLRGFIDPIGVNPNTGSAFDGNGRTKVCRQMHKEWLEDKSKPVPAKIKVKGNDWFVPTIEVAMSEDEEVSAAAALNHIGLLGGYDEAFQLEILLEMKEKGTDEATGFTEADFKDLLRRFGKDEDKSPAIKTEEELAALGVQSGAPDSGGAGAGAPETNIKQVALLYNPEQHKEFVELAVKLAPKLGTDNAADTVLASMRKVNETFNSEANSE